jgi:mannose/fructose/N-acetylgalactosamine-specific phosphotransferase system component IIC
MTDPLLITGVSLAIAFICLDQTVAGQVMLSQPLVGGWLLGALLGVPMEGLAAGALLQFLCLTEMTLGASIPPDNSLAALVGTALYLTSARPPQWTDAAFLGAVVVLFFPLAWLARSLDIVVRRVNRRWTAAASSLIDDGRYGAAQMAALGGIPLFFARAFLFSWIALWLLGSLSAASPQWSSVLSGPLGFMARLAPFAGLGVIAARKRHSMATAVVAAGFCLGLLLSWRLV